MQDTKSSRRSRVFESLAVLAAVAALSAAAVWWFYSHGYTLYYGDAEAHLNIARRIVDSRTPGLWGIGTVWLPLPHLLMAALAWHDGLWRSGLGGAIPVAACFVAAAMFLFLAARRIYGDRAAALTVVCLFALNPNLLYLQAIPMTEPVFFAALAALLYCAVRFRESQSMGWAAAAGAANLAATLTRYEGWFLIPFAAGFFFLTARRRRVAAAALFGSIASLGPLVWMAHNWYHIGDALDFYRGPYSAKAIYQRGLEKGYERYRGDHDWGYAWLYYRNAVRVTLGWPVIWLGVAGAVAARIQGKLWPLALLVPPPLFYVWSMYSGGTPIYMPHLWPFSYYNTRYGLEALPALALASGALAAATRPKWRRVATVAVVAAAVLPWTWIPRPEGWICWKESQVNSVARRAWTREAAEFLAARYMPGTGVFLPFGDLTGILRMAGIPLREALHEDNPPDWLMAVSLPQVFLRQEWAIYDSEGVMSKLARKAVEGGPRYHCLKVIAPKGEPEIRIYKRN
jgi:4-amino-4-deoxy-L-arabinose transferase-like glycosyltransferase